MFVTVGLLEVCRVYWGGLSYRYTTSVEGNDRMEVIGSERRRGILRSSDCTGRRKLHGEGALGRGNISTGTTRNRLRHSPFSHWGAVDEQTKTNNHGDAELSTFKL